MSLLKLLRNSQNYTRFTTPSHSQKSPFLWELKDYYMLDYSENEGFDNLHCPTGEILMAQGRASDIYGTQKTFFLTNGSTSGILATMLASLKRGDKILAARNCHKAVYNGAVLAGAEIDWLIPNENSEWGIYGEIGPKELENALKMNDYKMFIMVSPTYEGINSDIEAISKICKQYKTLLFTDEAHGALYNFSSLFPKTAIQQGADFSVNSLHKNAGSPNPCALLHLSKGLSSDWCEKLQNALNLITTTSPPYPMLACIEANISYLNSKKGTHEIERLFDEIETLDRKLTKIGWEFLKDINHDTTKMLIKKDGINPKKLSEQLFEKFKIEDEITGQRALMFLTGVGTTANKFTDLKRALRKVKLEEEILPEVSFQPFPFVKLSPSEAAQYGYTYVDVENALLKLSSEIVTSYPPCTPILYPGEAVQEWHLYHLKENVGVLKK